MKNAMQFEHMFTVNNNKDEVKIRFYIRQNSTTEEVDFQVVGMMHSKIIYKKDEKMKEQEIDSYINNVEKNILLTAKDISIQNEFPNRLEDIFKKKDYNSSKEDV